MSHDFSGHFLQADVLQSELCEALSHLSHTLSRITYTLHSPADMDREARQLRMLNLQVTTSHHFTFNITNIIFFLQSLTCLFLCFLSVSQVMSSQLTSLSCVMSSIGSQITGTVSSETSDATQCVEQITACISSIQKAIATQEKVLSRELGHTLQPQVCPI